MWINGAFGAGKTTVARKIADALPNSVIVDPEDVGSTLRASLQGVAPRRDFQEWAAWRRVTVELILAISAEVPNSIIIVPQTIADQRYWTEISSGLTSMVDLLPVSLEVSHDVHRRRVEADRDEPDARRWRLHRFRDFEGATWIADEFHIVDNDSDAIDVAVRHLTRLVSG
ncbi:AAA family ATPase [Corynebacterium sp. NPDC060344]|uniref:AAA family ATPase n=1 Tax=Corynebacterium sp. NPDC060344 TaxID=3347101 RepID=UPI0036660406